MNHRERMKADPTLYIPVRDGLRQITAAEFEADRAAAIQRIRGYDPNREDTDDTELLSAWDEL